MEINQFKDIWQASFSGSEAKLSPEEIEAKLKIKSKTQNLMSKVKRSFHFEFILSVIMIAVLIIDFAPELQSTKEVLAFGIFLLFFAALLFYVYRKYRKIKAVDTMQDQLKPAIKQWISILEKYINFNTGRFAKYILLPFAILLGFFLGLIIGTDDSTFFDVILKLENQKIIIVIAVLVAFYLLFIPIVKWFNKKMYGRYLDEMKQCLKDLEEIDESEIA